MNTLSFFSYMIKYPMAKYRMLEKLNVDYLVNNQCGWSNAKGIRSDEY